MIIEAQDAIAAVVMDLNQMNAASVVAARVGDKTKAQIVQAEAAVVGMHLMKVLSAAAGKIRARHVQAEATVIDMNLNQMKEMSRVAIIADVVNNRVPAAPAEAVPPHQLNKQETQRSL